MESSVVPGQLVGWETHGFHAMEDLDIYKVEEEAQSRWLRPNEIYAILCNYRHFSINAKPLDTPASGTLIMFDRKALRNFRKDGHAWQKKKDGKTVKEAHEHLKVGNEERIHVYYAHGEDNPKFVRRSYWLLDRAYEHIVLVHYREVSEVSNKSIVSSQGGLTGRSHLSKRIYTPVVSPVTPSNSSSSSAYSAKPTSWISSEELDSTENASGYTHQTQASGFNAIGNERHQLTKWKDTSNQNYNNARTGSPEDLAIHQINTLDWEQLLEPQGSPEGITTENITQSHGKTQSNGQFETIDTLNNSGSCLAHDLCSEAVQQLNDGDQNFINESLYWEKPFQNDMPTGSTLLVEFGQSEVCRSEFKEHNQWAHLEQEKMIPNQWVEAQNVQSPFEKAEHPGYIAKEVVEPPTVCEPIKTENGNSFKKQDSFGRWLTSVLEDSSGLTDEGPNNTYRQEEELDSHVTGDESLVHGQVFCITEVSPMCAFSTEETKVIITGYFVGTQKDIVEAKWYCVFGEIIVPAEVVQIGVFRCKAPQHAPGIVNLFLTCNEQMPHSQILSFEYRVNAFIHLDKKNCSAQTDEVLEEFALQIRLYHLLFSSFKGTLSHGNKKTERVINMERAISLLFTNNEGDWHSLPKLVTEKRKSLAEAKSHLLDLILRKKLQEWVLEKMVDKSGATAHDSHGQGVIHLVAALGYEWAVIPISFVGMSVNFRDTHGWTALHWAAFYRREQMVAALLAAGANASMVSDPTPESPGGWTPADLAFNKGYEGLAGYLAEKALTTHLENLTLYDKNDPRKQTSSSEFEIYEYLTEDEICMRDSLAAVRTATEAAAKIHSAFREHSFKLKMKAFELADTTKEEALKMIAALKIQRAYKEHREKKKIVAAKRIQHVFRGWKTRKEFLNLRRQVIKIQAYFRGHKVRKHYRKILWSVGILEKAILRWRLKRKGLRGLQVDTNMSSEHTEPEPESGSDNIEDFFRIGRKYAEERVERSVVRVQAMYRSYKARSEYRRMKQCHNQAQLQYDQLSNLDLNMQPRDRRSRE